MFWKKVKKHTATMMVAKRGVGLMGIMPGKMGDMARKMDPYANAMMKAMGVVNHERPGV